MDYEKKIEIPFGAFDSELIHQEINIPNGFKAVIKGNKIILTRAESEDEEIKKAMINFFKSERKEGDTVLHYGVNIESMIAWLEKQGNSPIKWNKNTKDCKPKVSHSVLMKTTHGIAEGEWQGEHWHQYRWAGLVRDADVLSWMELSNLEKQGEQKPFDYEHANIQQKDFAPKVEPKYEESKIKVFDAPTPFEDKLYVFVAACEFLAIPSKIKFILEHSQEILDAAREQIGKEQSSAWSEEDELVVEDIEEAVINYWHGQSQEDLLDWLKSLKTKVQPKQEWSEKDEEELEIAIDTLKESGRYDSAKWVQSLKQRIGG